MKHISSTQTQISASCPPPGITARYNHDVNPSEDFLRDAGLLSDALRYPKLLNSLYFYEAKAKFYRRMFHTLGIGSLVFSLLSLSCAAFSLIAAKAPTTRFGPVSVISDSGSLIAIALIIWGRIGRYRGLWCQAVFCRERLRQWHFQLFLDGQLIGLLWKDLEAFKAERERRWGILQQDLADGFGLMSAFVRHESSHDDIFHRTSTYDDLAVAERVLEIMRILRFDHQVRFSQRKQEVETEQLGMALEERTTLSEAVATATLAGAVLVGAFAFLVSLSQSFSMFSLFAWHSDIATRSLSGAALLLAVLSAASRAYRAGYTLPDESESYENYSDRIREHRALFDNARSDGEKFRELKGLEVEAASELRRFLKMKMRATFIS